MILLQLWCSDPTSKHAGPKYNFLPESINLLSFRLQVAVSHIALADYRTLYLTTRDTKKIMKVQVPEDTSAVRLVLNWYLSTSVFLTNHTATYSIIGYHRHVIVICMSVHLSVTLCIAANWYILQQKCLNKWIGTAPNLHPRWESLQNCYFIFLNCNACKFQNNATFQLRTNSVSLWCPKVINFGVLSENAVLVLTAGQN